MSYYRRHGKDDHEASWIWPKRLQSLERHGSKNCSIYSWILEQFRSWLSKTQMDRRIRDYVIIATRCCAHRVLLLPTWPHLSNARSAAARNEHHILEQHSAPTAAIFFFDWKAAATGDKICHSTFKLIGCVSRTQDSPLSCCTFPSLAGWSASSLPLCYWLWWASVAQWKKHTALLKLLASVMFWLCTCTCTQNST